MNPRARASWQLLILAVVLVILALIFPPAYRFVEMAARELRYFWWLILIVVLACWFIWGIGRKPRA